MIFDSLISPKQAAATPAPHDDFWYSAIGLQTNSGIRLTPELAMRCTPVNASVKILSETVASLPLFVFQVIEGGKQKATNHPLYDLLHDRPNSWQSSFEWRETMQRNCALWGNAYSRIVPGPRGPVDELVPLASNRVTVRLLDNGRLRYEYSNQRGETEVYSQDEVFHLRWLSSEGYVGTSPIDELSEPVAMSLAAEAYGARFFQNDAQPNGWIEHPAHFGDDSARQRFRDGWQSAQTGENRHKTAVLEDGLKYHATGSSNRDSQYLETRKFQVEEVARIYNIPLPYLKDDARSTFANSEQKAIDFVVHTIRPWLVRWEQAMSRDLFIRPDLYFPQFSIDALLRGDIKSRYEAYGNAVTAGWITRNEVRELENRNPIDGLDEPLHQAALIPEGDDMAGEVEGFTSVMLGVFDERAQHEDRMARAIDDAVDHAHKDLVKRQAGYMQADERLGQLTEEAAKRIATREVRAARKALATKGHEGMKEWADEFYTRHAEFFSTAACVETARGDAYATASRADLLAAVHARSPEMLDEWEARRFKAAMEGVQRPVIQIVNEAQSPPVVEVTNEITNQIETPKVELQVEAPDVTVQVPEQVAPVVNVENKIEPAPVSVENKIETPTRSGKLRIVRDGGKILGAEEVEQL